MKISLIVLGLLFGISMAWILWSIRRAPIGCLKCGRLMPYGQKECQCGYHRPENW